MSPYIAVLTGLILVINDVTQKVNVGFKLQGFKIPGKGVIDTVSLVEEEQEKLDIINAAKTKAEKAKAEELFEELLFPEFVANYVENNHESAIFDIISDEEAANVMIEESKFDLAEEVKGLTVQLSNAEEQLHSANIAIQENTVLKKQLEELKAELEAHKSQLNKESTTKAKTEEPAE